MWEHWIHDTQSGTPLQQVYPAACTWARRLTGTGTGTATFKLADGTSIPDARSLLTAWSRTLVVRSGTFVAYAGLITRRAYDRDAGTVQASLSELRSLFSKRPTGGALNYGSGWNLNIQNRSPAGAVRMILQRVLGITTAHALPVDLPAGGAGSYSRDVRYWETVTASDLFEELEKTGVEIDFRPYLTPGGSLRWAVDVTERIERGATDLTVNASQSVVNGLSVVEDGASQATGVIVTGKGTGADMLVAGSARNPYGIPARDEKREAKDIDIPIVLQAQANYAMAEAADVTEQWSFGVRLEDPVTPQMVQPGRIVRLDVRDDQWIPSGVYQRRIIALSGDMTVNVKPEVQ